MEMWKNVAVSGTKEDARYYCRKIDESVTKENRVED